MGGGFTRAGIYVYLWLIYVDVWQDECNIESNYPPIKNKFILKIKNEIYMKKIV